MQPGEVVAVQTGFLRNSVDFRLQDEMLVTLWFTKSWTLKDAGFMAFTADQNLARGEYLFRGGLAGLERLKAAAADDAAGSKKADVLRALGHRLGQCADKDALYRELQRLTG